jgi:hypothetical protein
VCKCECGTIRSVNKRELSRGRTKSCGCQRILENKSRTTHGLSESRIYKIWGSMKQRCSNPNRADYSLYGGKGIKVCQSWLDFEEFLKWSLKNGYAKNLSIDRIDTNGDYEPANCRWVTNIRQQNNKSNNHFITYMGKTMSMKDWSRRLKIPYKTLKARASLGWDPTRMFNAPIKKRVNRHLVSEI